MVLVLLKTLVNSKWVLIVVTGFGACVCTLGLNWFGYGTYCLISNDPATPRSLPSTLQTQRSADIPKWPSVSGPRCATSARG
jgi:hypothetical protein